MAWNLFRRRTTATCTPARCSKPHLEQLEDRLVLSFHLWQIDQVFSSANGKEQFIELHDTANGENRLAGQFISSQTTGNRFTFPADLPTSQTANHHFLIGTSDYAKLPGAVTPDYTVPDNFFSVSRDTLNYANVNSFTFGAGQLPTDGIHALSIGSNGSVTTIVNSETNLAGKNGSVSATAPRLVPDLTITMSHVGIFRRGDRADTYAVTVRNVGAVPTNGSMVTVTDTLPAGLAPTAADRGTINGWTVSFSGQTITATRSDVLASGSSYPVLTLAVSVAGNAPASVTNTVHVSGGGDIDTSNNDAFDVTTILGIVKIQRRRGA